MGSAWVDTTSVYGPAFTLASEPLAVVAGDSDAVAAWTYKSLAAAAALARRPARRAAGPPQGVRDRARRLEPDPRGAPGRRRAQRRLGRRLDPGGTGALGITTGAERRCALDRSRSRSSGCRPSSSRFASLESRATGRPQGVRGLVVRGGGGRDRRHACSTAAPGRSRSSRSSGTRRSRRATRSRTGSSSSGCRTTSRSRSRRGAGRSGSSSSRGRRPAGARASRLAACLVLVTTPYLAVWYLAWAVPARRCRGGRRRDGRGARSLRLPVAADDPDLRPLRLAGGACGGR